MQSEQAVQFAVKFEILVDPGGETGDVFFSFTVDAFFGTGAVLFCADKVISLDPKRTRRIPAIAFRLPPSTPSPLSISGSADFLFNDTILYSKALSGQLLRQLKQLTHLERSISLFRKSMHDDLQATAHRPHFVHRESSNLIRKKDTFDRRPRNVPTGHTVLQ